MPRRGPFVLAVVLPVHVLGCGDPDPPNGIYVSDCDPEATLTFASESEVAIEINYCEGYAVDDLGFTQDGDSIVIAHPANRNADPVVFEMTDPGLLTLKDEGWSFTCGNCAAGDTWERR